MTTVGSKFRVTPEILTGNYFRVNINNYMRHFANKIVTIKGYDGRNYCSIDEDSGHFVWSPDLLKKVSDEEYNEYCNSDFPRIVPEDVAFLFNVEKATPLIADHERLLFDMDYSGKKLYSALGLIAKKMFNKDTIETAEPLFYQYFEFMYLRGFMMGWSNITIKKETFNANDRFIVGYDDGKNSYKKVTEEAKK